MRALKNYARSLKYLAEDWAPVGQPLPEVMTMPPPVALDDEDENEFVKQQQAEIERLKSKNRSLEENVRIGTSAALKSEAHGGGDVQGKIL